MVTLLQKKLPRSLAQKQVKRPAQRRLSPLTVKTYDVKGNEVEQVFDKAPEKVITNNLSTTEILLELGLKDKIAGMLNPDNAVTDKYKDAIATIPQIGDKKQSHKRQSFLMSQTL